MKHYKQIKELIESLGVEVSVTPESNLTTDLQLDSLDHTELIMLVEEEFGVDCPDKVADTLLTVRDLCEWVEKESVKGELSA